MKASGRNQGNYVGCGVYMSQSDDLEKMSFTMLCDDVNYRANMQLNKVGENTWAYNKTTNYGQMEGGDKSEDDSAVLMTCRRKDMKSSIQFDCEGYCLLNEENLRQATPYNVTMNFSKDMSAVTTVGTINNETVYHSDFTAQN